MDQKNETTAGRFNQFLKSIQPRQDDFDFAKAKHKWIREQLQGSEGIKKVFLSGSYKRRTAIHPLHDVDIFVVFDSSGHSEEVVNQLLNKLIQKLKLRWNDGNWTTDSSSSHIHVSLSTGEQLVLRKQRCSVGICFGKVWKHDGVTFDLIPAFHNTDGTYTIYRRGFGATKTNPSAAQENVKAYNAAWGGGMFGDLVKLAKKWNSRNVINYQGQEEKLFKSFQLEALCYQFAATQPRPPNLRVGIHRLFAFLAQSHSNQIPLVDSSAEMQRSGPWKQKDVKNIIEKALQNAAKASENESDEKKARLYWQEIFGSEF